jgi:hypothetical protein
MSERLLDNKHWSDKNHVQRMSVEDWKTVLLNNQDTMIFRGNIVKLVAYGIGYGVVEIRKELPNENDCFTNRPVPPGEPVGRREEAQYQACAPKDCQTSPIQPDAR